MSQNRIKSFEELNKVFLNNTFDAFVKANSRERARIMESHDLEYHGVYAGKYRKKKGTVLIEGKQNPFTGKPLEVTLYDKRAPISDKETVTIKLTAYKDNGKLTPENLFVGKHILSPKQEIEKHEASSIPIYTQKELEEEKRRKEEQEKQRKDRIRQENIQRELERKKEEERRKQEIGRILKERKIWNLIHFTRIENLESIMEHGILSRDLLNENRIWIEPNDYDRNDHRTDCTSVSVEYPNHQVMDNFGKQNSNLRWVMIVLDSAVLLDHRCYFAEDNAASWGIARDWAKHKTAEALLHMFDPVVTVEKKYSGPVSHYRKELRNNFPFLPTCEQAEILIEGVIQRKYIKSIWFMEEKDRQTFAPLLSRTGIGGGVDTLMFELDREQYRDFKSR